MYAFMVIGHRGAAGYEPENTLRSFRRAIDLGVDWIELDVRRTADGHLVVIHDDTVDRTTGGRGKVGEMTLAELKKLDAGKGERIPMLQEVIDLSRGKVRLIVEVKQEGTEAEVVHALEINGFTDSCIVSSFHLNAVLRVNELSPRMMTAAIVSHLPVDFKSLSRDTLADSIFIRKDIATAAFVDEAHKNGFTVCIWNEDEPDEIGKYAAMGADFLSSNYPDRLKKIEAASAA